jgi:thiamine-phosphate pyrophosphorylase
MNAELTPGAERALATATAWATRLGEAEVAPLHLLLGLLDEDEGLVAQLVRQQGLEVATLRERLIAEAPLEPIRPGTAHPQPLEHALIRAVVFAAQPLAHAQTGAHVVATDHLFFALLQQESELRARLGRLGFRTEAVTRETEAPPLPLDEPLDLTTVTDLVDTDRILDATANRAREAARVLEDFARFVLDDPAISTRLKNLRHELSQCCAAWPAAALTAARETLRDVGTHLSTPDERERSSPLTVAVANAKRLQEALRSLEEFSKLRDPRLAERFEQLRYASYTIEKMLVTGLESRRRLAQVQLCMLISVRASAAAIEWTIGEAAAGGVDMVQLREKQIDDREWLHRARRAAAAARAAGVLFIVNDRPDLARLVEADGVHLGQTDLPVHEARRVLGPGRLIGVSTHSLAEVDAALADGADYLGVGPTFPSHTKSFPHLAGLDFVRAVSERTRLPAFAIGGITPDNVRDVVQAGLRRVAVGQALTQADEPRRVAQQLKASLLG